MFVSLLLKVSRKPVTLTDVTVISQRKFTENVHKHTDMHAHAHAHTIHKHTHTDRHTHAHTHTHTHTHTHKHIHSYTGTQICLCFMWFKDMMTICKATDMITREFTFLLCDSETWWQLTNPQASSSESSLLFGVIQRLGGN